MRTNMARQPKADLKDAKGTKLVLLGIGAGPGGQGPERSRKMTSHVMLSNGAVYVLDCGIGVIDQYARAGIPFSALRSIFITITTPLIQPTTSSGSYSILWSACILTCAPSARRRTSK